MEKSQDARCRPPTLLHPIHPRFKLTRYAENHNIRVLVEYVDAGFSGKNVLGRPQFRQMMDDIIKAQPSKRPVYVLVFKLSRFGRNAADS
ncbi:MAG TPA: recombinase family protein [Aeriscardovia aeriphila]|uniref:Recombinase family protein n=1 Tax=Aeriscardovia aeriphila TaxID=218139 RepID=A0A921FU22_9BIFI|nr:recombinase family protein [Aeriscardovia aeriphila]